MIMQSAGGPNGKKTIKLVRATAVELAEFEQQKRQVRCFPDMPSKSQAEARQPCFDRC